MEARQAKFQKLHIQKLQSGLNNISFLKESVVAVLKILDNLNHETTTAPQQLFLGFCNGQHTLVVANRQRQENNKGVKCLMACQQGRS